MKRIGTAIILVLVLVPLPGQQIREERSVVNVGVPVRVFDGTAFVDNLSLSDFEVLEDDVSQKLEAVYLVHQTAVRRREELSRFDPTTVRHFYMFFEISEYTAQIGEALTRFVEDVLAPGDRLTVVTPTSTYRLRPQILESRSKVQVIQQLTGILRRDTLAANSEYLGLLKEVEDIAQSLAMTLMAARQEGAVQIMQDSQPPAWIPQADTRPEDYIPQYVNALSRLLPYRKLDQDRLLRFAASLKNEDAQKFVFLFYQREFIPEVEPRLINPYLNLSPERPDLQQMGANLTGLLKESESFNMEAIKRAYADASIAIHFLFIAKPAKHMLGLVFNERSEDIYSAFREMATSTGGFFDSSANPRALLKNAVNAAENYYLLYYSPAKPERDGRFREISIRVKSGSYRVVHRRGYIAD